MPKSYLPNEPGARRAAQCGFDPYLQVRTRLATFSAMGHTPDKVELLILGDQVKAAIMARQTAHELRRLSIDSAGLVTLLEDGIAKAARGKVSLPDVIKRLPRLDRPRPLLELRRLLGG